MKAHVGTGGLYMRKWEKAKTAGRNRRAVYAANGDRKTEAGGK